METNDRLMAVSNVAIAIIICSWLLWLWGRRKWYAFALHFPGKIGLPYFGVLRYLMNPHHFLSCLTIDFKECNSNTICTWIGLYPILVTADPELAENVLTSSEYIDKAMPIYERLGVALNDGLLTCPAKEWRLHRKCVSPVFKHNTLLSFFPILNKAKNGLCNEFDKLAENGDHYLLQTILNTTLQASIEANLGKDSPLTAKEHSKTVQRFVYILGMTFLHTAFVFTKLQRFLKLHISYTKNLKILHKFVNDFMHQSFKELDQIKNTDQIIERPVIFVDQVYQLVKENKYSWNDVIKDSIAMLAATLETTANTIFSVLVLLATHPEVQERVFEELSNVFKSDKNENVEVQYEHFEQLPYLEMVIQETMRLTPAIPLIGRQIKKPLKLSNGDLVPEGLQILISIFHLHRRKDIWGPNADKFNPDHFLLHKISERHACSYIPFSKGARNCIGWRYAQFSLRIMLAGILCRFRFETDTKFENLEFKENITFSFLKEPALRIYRRK